jgi:hypothetical protein
VAALGVQTHLQQFKEKVAKTKVVEFLSAVARNDQHNVQEVRNHHEQDLCTNELLHASLLLVC